jgi:hypothetical protein
MSELPIQNVSDAAFMVVCIARYMAVVPGTA